MQESFFRGFLGPTCFRVQGILGGSWHLLTIDVCTYNPHIRPLTSLIWFSVQLEVQ